MCKIGSGLPLSPFGALITLDIENAKVMAGIAYSIRKRLALGASGVANIVFDPTAFQGKNIVFLPVGFDSLGGPIAVDIHAGISADPDGTLWTPYNRDFKSITVSDAFFRLEPSNIGDLSPEPIELLLPSDGIGSAGSSSASTTDPLVANIDFSKKYLIQLTNTDATGGASIGIKFDFFEVQ